MGISSLTWAQYFWPGSSTLRNKIDEHDPQRLARLEQQLAAARMAELQANPVQGTFDLQHMQEIHRRIFQDVYDWAGQLRTAPTYPQRMVKGGPSPESIKAGHYGADDRFEYGYFPAGDPMTDHADKWLSRLGDTTDFANLSPIEFAHAIAEPWGEVNAAHPFREGNTRTQVIFFTQFAEQNGHTLDNARLAHDKNFRDQFNAARFLVQYNTDTTLFAATLAELIDGVTTLKPAPDDSLTAVVYEPHYLSTYRHGAS